jgi:murein DD-endopeptidase MepM/ murein hydrolase activator NlpD
MPIVLLAAVIMIVLAHPPLAACSPIIGPTQGQSAAAGLVVVTSTTASPRWRSPLRGPMVVHREFQPPRVRWAPGHRGVDLAAAAGSLILAAGSGRIAFAGRIAGRGVISIEHSPGVRTTYEPVRAVVVAGQFVRKGDRIGYLAPDRRHPDSLHWGLRIRDGYADPMRLLRARPMLKPRSRSEVPTSSAYLTHGGELDR